MMCGIDEAVRHLREDCQGFAWTELIVNRLDYHRQQAEGVKPKWHRGDSIKDYYTCGNCGFGVIVNNNYCPNCGYMIKWDSCRCLTGLPLVDMVEVKK